MQSLLKLGGGCARAPYAAAYYPQGHDLAEGRGITPRSRPRSQRHRRIHVPPRGTIYGGSNEIQKNIVSKALFSMAGPVEQPLGDDDLQLLARSVEQFLDRDYGHDRRQALIAGGRDAQRQGWNGLAELGWLAAGLPKRASWVGPRQSPSSPSGSVVASC